MSEVMVYAGTGVILFFMGVFGLVFRPLLLQKALALNVTGAGIFLFMVAQAYNGPGATPDPVPHGLVLTGIVIAASATALMLFLVAQLRDLTGELSLSDPSDEGDASG